MSRSRCTPHRHTSTALSHTRLPLPTLPKSGRLCVIMAHDQQELWRAAAVGCEALAAALPGGNPVGAAVVDELARALGELNCMPDSEPTAEFLRCAPRSGP